MGNRNSSIFLKKTLQSYIKWKIQLDWIAAVSQHFYWRKSLEEGIGKHEKVSYTDFLWSPRVFSVLQQRWNAKVLEQEKKSLKNLTFVYHTAKLTFASYRLSLITGYFAEPTLCKHQLHILSPIIALSNKKLTEEARVNSKFFVRINYTVPVGKDRKFIRRCNELERSRKTEKNWIIINNDNKRWNPSCPSINRIESISNIKPHVTTVSLTLLSESRFCEKNGLHKLFDETWKYSL